MSDAELLARFVTGRGGLAAEAAFAALVDRHGPMVLGVCRRVTGDRHAADDAFQAVFLVLARKAHAVRLGADDSLGRWLYGVSLRVARRARADGDEAAPLRRGTWTASTRLTRRRLSTLASGPTSAPRSTPRSPACRRAIDPRWCSATSRGSPRSRPPGGSVARSARWRAACTGRGSVCGRAWPGGAWRRRSGAGRSAGADIAGGGAVRHGEGNGRGGGQDLGGRGARRGGAGGGRRARGISFEEHDDETMLDDREL